MKSTRSTIGRALDRPDRSVRLYLFHGADEAASRALGERLLTGLGGAAKHSLDPALLRSNPALLADEAAALSLFGEARAVWIEPAGDELAAAAQALLELSAVENPVIALAGGLRRTSALLKLAEAAPQALAHVSYPLDPGDAARMVVELGRDEGLRIDRDSAARIAAACGGDRAIVALELAKLALYLDSSPADPKPLDHAALDALSADFSEGDAARVGDLALAGDPAAVAGELDRLGVDGVDPVTIVRALQRRLLMLAPLRARIERGEAVGAVLNSAGKSLFWRDKPVIASLVSNISAARLSELVERVARLEGRLMRPAMPANSVLGEELIGIAVSQWRAGPR